jgi:hypothetical protein
MDAATILRWFHDSAYGVLVRDVYWLFTVLEIVHFIALCVLFGSILVIDLRVLGLQRQMPLQVALRFVPAGYIAFAFALASGLGFFCSAPLDYWPNPSFRLKIFLMLAAGANVAWFAITERRSPRLASGEEAPIPLRMSAALSLLIWTVVIVLGRLLPYTGTSQ